MRRRLWRTETGLFLGIWLVLMVTGRSRLLRDPGTFWHTVLGQQIIERGEFVWTDSFSFTCTGQPWIARQWLGECVMALLHQWAGLDGLLVATVTILAALYAWVGSRLIRGGMTGGLAILLTVLTMAASAYHFHARPHLSTIILLGWTFARLCDFDSGRVSVRSLFWLVPVFAVWMNIHDGVVGGLATLVLVVAGWVAVAAVGRLTGRDRAWLPLVPAGIATTVQRNVANADDGTESRLPARTVSPAEDGPECPSCVSNQPPFLMLALLVLGCGATALLTPYGSEVPRAWFTILNSPVVGQLMDEHRPLIESSECWFVLLFAGIYVAALAGVGPHRLRVTWLIPLVWLYLAWTRIRHGPLFAITAVIALAEMWPHVAWVRWLDRHKSALFHLRSPDPGAAMSDVQNPWDWQWLAVPFALLLGVAGLQTASVEAPVVGRGWAQLDRTHWPVDLLPELRRYEREHPPGTPIFNDMLFGGFLIYHTPGLRVFIDDRCELYGDEFLQAYVDAMSDDAQIDRWAQQYGFDLALVTPGSAFDSYLIHAAGWRRQGESTAARLYLRE